LLAFFSTFAALTATHSVLCGHFFFGIFFLFVVLQTAGKVKQRCREMYSASRYGSEQLVLAQVLTEFSEKDVSKYFTMCGFSHSGAFDPFKNHDIFLKEAHLLQSKKKKTSKKQKE
jgi:hypothetical protein